MRKFFISFTCVLLSAVTCFAGCSCALDADLVFNSDFLGKKTEVSSNYYEQMTYTVKYNESYGDYSKNESLNNGQSSFSFGEGSYVSTLETFPSLDIALNSKNCSDVETDIDEIIPSNAQTVFCLTTEFKMPVTYIDCCFPDDLENLSTREFSDTIESKVFFCSSSLSFAPIYSKVTYDYTTFSNYGEIALIGNVKATREIFYNQSNYKVKEDIAGTKQENTYEYTFRTAIDNAQLLFALRNFEVEEEKATLLKVVSPSYGEAKDLLIQTSKSSQKNITGLSINENSYTTDVSVKNISFNLYGDSNTGMKQDVVIQKAPAESDNEGLPYRALLVSYVSPLIAYGTMLPMGVLEYTLTSVQYK